MRRWNRAIDLGERAARHVARMQRRQLWALLDAMTRRNRRPLLLPAVFERLRALEPIAAATLRDAQRYGFLQGAVTVAGTAPPSLRRNWENRQISSGRIIGSQVPPPEEPPEDGGSGGGAGNGPGSSSGASGGDERPVIRFPAVEAGGAYIASLTPLLPDDYERATDEARRTAFTVARAQNLKAVDSIRGAIEDDIRHGGTLADFRDVVRDAVDTALSDSQAEALYRTYTGRGFSAGQVAVFDSPGVRTSVPYLKYTSIHDDRVRDEHAMMEKLGLDGTAVYRADDPIWDVFWPPWAWNCRCGVIPLDVHGAAEYGVREAIEWLRTGRPPANPQYVAWPTFRPPKGWVPSGRALSLAW